MIFKKATLASLIFLLLAVGTLVWQLGIITEKDQQSYLELAALSNLKAIDAKESYNARQERFKIVKEFFLENAKGEIKLVKIKCQTSSLLYGEKEGQKEIIEKMGGVVCLIQENTFALFPDGRKVYKDANGQFTLPDDQKDFAIMQEVQRIRSLNATYHYQSQILQAEDVIVERFVVPGVNWPDNFESFAPVFFAKAKHGDFSFHNGVSFKASDVDASLSNTYHLVANSAKYEKQHLQLQGDVKFQQSLGSVYTQKADIYLDESSQISHIMLHDSLEFHLQDGSYLKALSGAIDCLAKKAHFYGDVKEKVYFLHHAPTDLNIESITMSIMWDNDLSSSKQMVKELRAEQEVFIQQGEGVYAFGDFASYSQQEIVLKNVHKNGCCKFLYKDQGTILADAITLQKWQKKAVFKNPHGFINSCNDHIVFSATTMEWDEKNHTLMLVENVVIEEPKFGIVKTQGPVSMSLCEGKISQIDCSGESFFVHIDQQEEEHYLTTCGHLFIDYAKQIAVITSKENEKMTYKDAHGHIMANRAFLTFNSDGKCCPKKLLLEEDICIVNQFSVTQGSLSQYVLADIAEYEFDNKELTLQGKESRVLFYDKINQVELSAPSLKIKRDTVTEKDSIRGIGDVRFVFADQELEKIKNRFKSLDKDPLL